MAWYNNDEDKYNHGELAFEKVMELQERVIVLEQKIKKLEKKDKKRFTFKKK